MPMRASRERLALEPALRTAMKCLRVRERECLPGRYRLPVIGWPLPCPAPLGAIDSDSVKVTRGTGTGEGRQAT